MSEMQTSDRSTEILTQWSDDRIRTYAKEKGVESKGKTRQAIAEILAKLDEAPQDPGKREKQLCDAVDAFNKIHDDWSNDVQLPNPPISYWDAFEDLLSIFQNGDEPYSCRAMTQAMWDFAKEKTLFDNLDAPLPNNSFWFRRQELHRHRQEITKKNTRPKLEPVGKLDKDQVPAAQICKMWGLWDQETNMPRLDLLQQELDNPGSVINADYVHPQDLRQMGARDLWEDGASLADAAHMLHVPEEQLSDDWKSFELAREEAEAKEAADAAAAAAEQLVEKEPEDKVSYRELQRQASQLHIKSFGKSAKELKALIAEHDMRQAANDLVDQPQVEEELPAGVEIVG